jgi:hypothetical protein
MNKIGGFNATSNATSPNIFATGKLQEYKLIIELLSKYDGSVGMAKEIIEL